MRGYIRNNGQALKIIEYHLLPYTIDLTPTDLDSSKEAPEKDDKT